MPTNRERMLAGELYDPLDPELAAGRRRARDLCFDLNRTREGEEETRRRARELCEHLEKVPVEVPDVPGFVVNRLLFPYLFSAVRLMEETGMHHKDVDTCMKLGAGHPIGPLALLDLVGLDVSKAIGEEIGADIPETVERLVAEGKLGRKTKSGLTL